jgi:hypothetical protein
MQWSVNQYLGTVKYRFILQISILYFFTGNIRISISMPSMKKYILIYWYFQYFSVSLWKHSKTSFFSLLKCEKKNLLCLSFKKDHSTAHHAWFFCYCLLLLICCLLKNTSISWWDTDTASVFFHIQYRYQYCSTFQISILITFFRYRQKHCFHDSLQHLFYCSILPHFIRCWLTVSIHIYIFIRCVFEAKHKTEEAKQNENKIYSSLQHFYKYERIKTIFKENFHTYTNSLKILLKR